MTLLSVARMAAAALVVVAAPLAASADDALPSWNNGPSKDAIVAFVEEATLPGGDDFVEPADRIAVFDNDGTLWSEQPVYFQLLFAFHRAAELAAADPAWAATPALKAAAAGDIKAVLAGGEEALTEITSATQSGMSVEAFTAIVAAWLKTARHPLTGRRYTEMVYRPMLELLDYLRANDFATYIVSGGGVDFMRAFTEEVYGIPPEQVIGSLGNARFEIVDGVPQVMKEPGMAFLDDKGGKPVAISRGIGKRPVFVAGNSDGDLAMAQWSAAGAGLRFVMFVHHTDGEREFAYDRRSHIGKFDKALDAAAANGWLVVDMATDWNRIWPD